MMALEGIPSGFPGAVYTVREVVAHDGLRGLYKGFGTVVSGLIPARMLYMAVLESTKAGTLSTLTTLNPQLSETAAASAASFVAGAAASLAGQLVVVPVDVVSQRLMIMGPRRINGRQLTQQILKSEGIRGLYRGFGASVATFVPSSAIWWSAYGAWQTILWLNIDTIRGNSTISSQAPARHHHHRSDAEIIGVQLVAGVLTGFTSAVLTNPLDVIKTRMQTAGHDAGSGGGGGVVDAACHRSSWQGTASSLLRKEGMQGFFKGVAPRMVNTAVWGTAMVTTYEFLKRLCALPDGDE
jgi:solute carrier family 25, member 44